MVLSRKIFSVWSYSETKMCKIAKCCCCFEVRTGAYIIAVLSIFRGIIFLIWLGYEFLNGNWFIEDVIYKNMKSSLNELDQGNLLRYIDNCLVWLWYKSDIQKALDNSASYVFSLFQLKSIKAVHKMFVQL